MQTIAEFGTPISWSAAPTPAHTPDEVQANLAIAEESCLELKGAQTYLSCDEYPCMLWVRGLDGLPVSLDACPEWPYPPAGIVHSTRYTDDGETVSFSVFNVMPPFAELPWGEEDLSLRLKYRRRHDESVALEAWLDQ